MNRDKRLYFGLCVIIGLICIKELTQCHKGVTNIAEITEINDADSTMMDNVPYENPFLSNNTVYGHLERDTIVGKFTGKEMDTLFVVCDTTKDCGEMWQYYAVSNNKSIPRLNYLKK